MEKGNSNERRNTGFNYKGRPVEGFGSKDMDAEVRHNLETNPSDDMVCKNCGDHYERGAWDFHSLCPLCFDAFDAQKMAGRIAYYKGEGSHN
jgi:hypothetical protein